MFAAREVVTERFEIVRFVAVGGMGEVYEAFDSELATRVALNIIHPSLSGDERALKRFKREVQLARKVTHENVWRVFDVFR